MITSVGLNLSDYAFWAHPFDSVQELEKAHPDKIVNEPNVFSAPTLSSEQLLFGFKALSQASGNSTWQASKTGWSTGITRIPGWLLWEWITRLDEVEGSVFAQAGGPLSNFRLSDLFRAYPLISDQVAKCPTGIAVVPMPETFDERLQARVLRNIPLSKNKARLLWRSVSGFLGFAISVNSTECLAEIANKHVLVVDLENSYVEASLLKIKKINNGLSPRSNYIPIRSLPSNETFFKSTYPAFDVSFYGNLIEFEEKTARYDEVLRMTWGHNGIGHLASLGNQRPERILCGLESGWSRLNMDRTSICGNLHSVLEEGPLTVASEAINWLHMNAYYRPAESHSVHSSIERLVVWLEDLRTKPDYILFTGSLTNFIQQHDGRKSILSTYLSPLFETHSWPVLNGYTSEKIDLISLGAAHWGALHQQDLPGYLEYLPNFSLVGRNSIGEEVHHDLINLTDNLATGGRLYRNADLKNIAQITSGSKQVRFRFDKNGDQRMLLQEFPKAPSKDCKLSFEISLIPSQGFADVRITADVPSFMDGEPLFLNWDRLEEVTPEDMDGSIGWPDTSPIAPESFLIEKNTPALERYINAVERALEHQRWTHVNSLISDIGAELQNGRTLGSAPKGKLAKSFIKAVYAHGDYLVGRYPYLETWYEETNLKHFTRVATALYTDTPEWVREMLCHILDEFEESNTLPPPIYVHGIGRCFSEKEEVRLFIKTITSHFKHRLDRQSRFSKHVRPKIGMNHWCSAMQLMLRLYPRVASYIPTTNAETLFKYLVDLIWYEKQYFKSQDFNPGVSAPCRNAMLSIFYLLRVRAASVDQAFLHHDSELAKTTCELLKSINTPEWAWVPRHFNAATGETIQLALIRLILHEGTVRDVQILTQAEKEEAG